MKTPSAINNIQSSFLFFPLRLVSKIIRSWEPPIKSFPAAEMKWRHSLHFLQQTKRSPTPSCRFLPRTEQPSLLRFFGHRYKSILTIPLLKSDPELRRTWREWREWRTFLMMIVSLSFSCQGSNRFASFTWESLTHKTKKWETISIEKLLEPNQVFLCLTLTDWGAATTCPLTNSPQPLTLLQFFNKEEGSSGFP